MSLVRKIAMRQRRARDIAQISTYQLNRIIGDGRSKLASRIEACTRKNPSITTVVAVADALGVSLDWLCGRDDCEPDSETVFEHVKMLLSSRHERNDAARQSSEDTATEDTTTDADLLAAIERNRYKVAGLEATPPPAPPSDDTTTEDTTTDADLLAAIERNRHKVAGLTKPPTAAAPPPPPPPPAPPPAASNIVTTTDDTHRPPAKRKTPSKAKTATAGKARGPAKPKTSPQRSDQG